MPRYGRLYDLFSGRRDPGWIKIVRALIGLFAVFVIDQLAGMYSVIALYVLLVIWVANMIGGNFSYWYAVGIAACRLFSPDFTQAETLPIAIWQFGNLLIAYEVIAYLICKKNTIMGKLERFSVTDPLTSLLNRRGFLERLEMALAHSDRHGEELSVAYIDVDNFKQVNDKHGHETGDILLRRIANTLEETLRAEDVPARLGGDEFAIVFPYTVPPTDAFPMVNRIKEALDKNCRGFDVSFSIGVVHYTGKKKLPVDQLVKFADELMYNVKKSTKNAVSARYI